MARVLGYDTRVVLGFKPEYDEGGHFTITGKNVHAWAEVRFAHAGWVSFDPTPTAANEPPTTSPAPEPSPDQTASPSQQNNSQTNPNDQAPQPRNPTAHGSVQPTNRFSTTALKIALLVMSGIAALIVLLALSPTIKAIRRQHRRTAGTPRRAIYGAWLETLDRLTERGIRIDRRATTRETAAKTPTAVQQHVQQLAELLDQACYAPEGATNTAPQAAWNHCYATRDILHHDKNLMRNMIAAVDPRPIWRRT